MSALRRALEAVKQAERALAEAKAACAALEQLPERESDPHVFATYSTVSELHAGGSWNPGPDTGELARAISERYDC